MEASGERSLDELRRLLGLLRRPDGAVDSRPQPSLDELDELVAGYRDAGLPVRLGVTGERRPLPEGVEVSVYRIVEEALTNALRHADPAAVAVTLAFRGSRLDVEVVDDGAAPPARGRTGTACSACASASRCWAASSRPAAGPAAATASRPGCRSAAAR